MAFPPFAAASRPPSVRLEYTDQAAANSPSATANSIQRFAPLTGAPERFSSRAASQNAASGSTSSSGNGTGARVAPASAAGISCCTKPAIAPSARYGTVTRIRPGWVRLMSICALRNTPSELLVSAAARSSCPRSNSHFSSLVRRRGSSPARSSGSVEASSRAPPRRTTRIESSSGERAVQSSSAACRGAASSGFAAIMPATKSASAEPSRIATRACSCASSSVVAWRLNQLPSSAATSSASSNPTAAGCSRKRSVRLNGVSAAAACCVW